MFFQCHVLKSLIFCFLDVMVDINIHPIIAKGDQELKNLKSEVKEIIR